MQIINEHRKAQCLTEIVALGDILDDQEVSVHLCCLFGYDFEAD